MPNSLTDTQWISLFHVLEVPYSTSYAALDGMGAAYVQTANQPILSAAKDVIIDFVTNTMEPRAVTMLTTWLDKWYAIADKVEEIQNGSVGEGAVTGITKSYAQQRALYKQYVQDLVPYFKYHEILARQQGSGAAGGINVAGRR